MIAAISNLYFPLTVFSALGCGLIAGVFFAFSTFVMNTLAQRPTAQGISTMQSINITVINPWFMGAFLGTTVTCILIAIATLSKWQQPSSIYSLIGSLFYLIGTFGVTIACNVPLNDALAIADPDSIESANLWAKYLVNWTLWNHVRTIAAFVAAASFTIGIGR